MAKYQVGDEVTVKGIISETNIRNNGLRIEIKTSFGSYDIPLYEREIATHTPRPREFKPGDRVRIIYTNKNAILKVVCVDKGEAWLIEDDGRRWTVTLNSLKHVDEVK